MQLSSRHDICLDVINPAELKKDSNVIGVEGKKISHLMYFCAAGTNADLRMNGSGIFKFK